MTLSQEIISGSVGDIVTVCVPSWEAAGFLWTARFDRNALKAVASETTGTDDMATRHNTVFRFELLTHQASLQLVLGRPGHPPRQMRDYLVGRVEGN